MAPFCSVSRPPPPVAARLNMGVLALAGLFSAPVLLTHTASAQAVRFGAPYHEGTITGDSQPDSTSARAPGGATGGGKKGGEHFRAKGHRPPPIGYQEAPSPDFQNGPDPDHQARVQRDRTTGADLSKFGTAYQDSSPVQSGSLGDATGNGWTAPRGNGW